MAGAPRSLLFVPGNREPMLAKAPAIPADAIVLDLEDSVPPGEKDAARAHVRDRIATWPATGPALFVRINPPRFGMVAEDAGALHGHPNVGVLVPKVDRAVELALVFATFGRERETLVNIETPRSLLRAEEFADTPGVTGLFLGGEDLTRALGMSRTPGGAELSWARFMLVTAARAGGVDVYDSICPEFRDMAVLEHDCRTAAAFGFDGKFAIHPAQIPLIHAAFTPTAEEVAQAQRIVAAYDDAVAHGLGSVAVDGQMVDPPVADRARALLQRAAR